jgi:hypothetical protein
MEFGTADTFTDSLAKLTGDEQKAVKTTAFDLQVSSAPPSLHFHKLDKPTDRRLWSIRVSKRSTTRTTPAFTSPAPVRVIIYR